MSEIKHLVMIGIFLLFIILVLHGMVNGDESQSVLSVAVLRCEYLENPLGIDTIKPRLSWQIVGERTGAAQSAYQIQAASTSDGFDSDALFWDTGKITSAQSIHISYAGHLLQSRDRVYWRVRIWDEDGLPTSWSKPSWFEMGLLSSDDWSANWIEAYEADDSPNAAPMFRKDFFVKGEIEKARAYVCGLGYHEFYLNGVKVGDNVLEPAQTDYHKRALYVVHDITDLLKVGNNTVGLWVGDGWFNQTKVYGHTSYGMPCAIVQLEIYCEDGTVSKVLTDESWQTGYGPILENNVHLGETYDARLEISGWSEPGFENAAWKSATVRSSPTESLQAQMMPGIQRIEEIRPVSVTEPEPGVYIVDMGQNFAGWAQLQIRGQAGQHIHMRFAEVLTPEGMLDPRSTGIPQADTYICRGDGLEIWEPRFTYHGFQYVELTGCLEPPNLETLTGVVVHSAVNTAGHFISSDPMINRIHETALWTQRSNLHGVPTDNPHRERCGWLGDAHVAAEMTIFNYDMALFWTKYIRDIKTSLIGGVAPTYVAPGQGNPGPASADWANALIQLPWYVYLYYGDKAVLEEHYDSCARWLEEVRTKWLDENLIHNQVGWNRGIGDWIPPGGVEKIDTPVPLTSTAYVYFGHKLMEKVSYVLGKSDRALFYADFATRQRQSFNMAFYDSKNHTYGSQTGNALALYLGLVPDGEEEKVAQRLAYYVREVAGGHHTTGILGTRYLFGQLSRFGYGDEAIGILKKETYPSIGWLFEMGATTLWENWGEGVITGENLPEDGRNQAMRGSFDTWFYDGLCGIQPDPEKPGFKHFYVRPSHAGDLNSASATYESPYGTIRVAWSKGENEGSLEVRVPPNSTATIQSPSVLFETLVINGLPVHEAEGVLKSLPDRQQVVVTAGTYSMTYKLLSQN